jgi:hypothetical protein
MNDVGDSGAERGGSRARSVIDSSGAGKARYEKEGQIGTISSIIGYCQSLTPGAAIAVAGVGYGRRLGRRKGS